MRLIIFMGDGHMAETADFHAGARGELRHFAANALASSVEVFAKLLHFRAGAGSRYAGCREASIAEADFAIRRIEDAILIGRRRHDARLMSGISAEIH